MDMESRPSGHAVRAMLMLLAIGAILVPAIVTSALRHPDGTAVGMEWVPPALNAGLLAAASAATVALLVVGLRHGTLAGTLLAGTTGALVGGALALLAGSTGLTATIAVAAVFTLAAAAAERGGARISGRRTRVGAAGAVVALAETAVVADLLPALAAVINPLGPSLLLTAAVLAGLATVITATRDLGLAAAALAAGALALALGDAAAMALGLSSLTGSALLAARSVIGASEESVSIDEGRLPPVVAHLSEGVLRFDGRLRLRTWNPAAAAVLGLDQASEGTRLEDLLGVTVQQLPAGSETVLRHAPLGGLDLSIHRDENVITIVIHEPAVTGSEERLGRELRGTIEELLQARRTIDLQRAELERATSTDPLTGVASRAAILERLRIEVAQARRYQHPVAVLLLDVDHFAEINTSRGIEGGDGVLREIALRARLRARAADALGRWGGHGLLSILPHTDEGGAATFADALRQRIVQRPVSFGEAEITVTLSAGVAVMRAGEDLDLDGLLARAEEALASARSAGGDRIALDRLHGLARLERLPDGAREDSAVPDQAESDEGA